MEIINKIKNTQKKWKLGDVLTCDDRAFGLIVKKEDGKICLMDITPRVDSEAVYSTAYNKCWFEVDSIEMLQIRYSAWHRVNAKLVIE